MRVSGLDTENDWQFGRGKASYISRGQAVRQAVVTRIKSFSSDFFLDVDSNIDWIDLLGRRNTQEQIKREVERVTLSTDGVTKITQLDISVNASTRNATITLSFGTIFDDEFTQEFSL